MNDEQKKLSIYLCGPIMDHEDEGRSWRERAKALLEADYKLLDPMRRNFRDREVDSANEIVEFCLRDIDEADLLLVNYNKASVGTSMEIFYAAQHEFARRKFIIAYSPFSFQDCSPWVVRHVTKILPSLQDACTYIRTHF